jgi:4-amino-4-deoxy-L-arabinose transferase-like glycosyltransferase
VRKPAIRVEWVAIGLITAGAAALRLVDLGAVRLDPFYDAAVRSMSLSWHNFLLGAYEPGGSVSIDKPPLDLWLQVASVKLLGWSSTSLKLPQALAGTAAAPLLYAALRRPFGVLAGLVAALALAVMPIAVVTARSDTMDAVMMMLLVLALLTLVRACETGSTWWLLGAAATLGVAFDVKLLESLVALPGLLAIAWLGLPARGRDADPGPRKLHWWERRPLRLCAAGVVFVAVALAWLTATLAVPASERPWAIGSTNGSAWNAAFVFNGTERITGKAQEPGQASSAGASTIAPPSPARLLARKGELPASWLGWEALAALALGIAVTVAVWRGGVERVARASATGLFVWLATGLVLFSAMTRLHPRYVEGFTPAVAALFGIGVAMLARASARTRGVRIACGALALGLLAALAVPLSASVEALESDASDAGYVGALGAAEQRELSAYLRANQGRARYELAAGSATSVASLIVKDAEPVLMLTTYGGRPLTSVGELRRLIASGEVR